MQALANFFDAINRRLGVTGPNDLMVHPVFIGFCILLLLYSLYAGLKVMAIILTGILGTGVIIHYLYPANPSDLGELFKFVGAMGGLALVLVYFGFIRE